jgi:hypothetical protein
MDIKSAKEQIKHAIVAYLKKDAFGDYRIPLEKQRPIFLLGAPGIGKTAIMEQVAQEVGIGLVSYSMTHHTRQSALGLPFIVRKNYGGHEYDVSEYTMSEIIASVYDTIEESGIQEGILFLDEINCVSETLAPAMLQFLQFKIFGRHRIPRGWIVVTAGNPPEYNKSVREFDIVTMDRLKRIDVEPDYPAWKEYAYQKSMHGAILTYLEIRKADFYTVETTVEGKSFVTARGWEDLSKMILLYEELAIAVDQDLVGQYLQNRRIAKEFAIYYDLYNKYRTDYQISQILAGQASDDIKTRASGARLDERLSLLGLLLDTVNQDMRACVETEDMVSELLAILREVKSELLKPNADSLAILDRQIQQLAREIEVGERANTLSVEKKQRLMQQNQLLESFRSEIVLQAQLEPDASFRLIKASFDKAVARMKEQARQTRDALHHLFVFAEAVFGEGHEMLVLVTELTINTFSAKFISRYGCDEYFAHNQELKLFERQQEIIAQLAAGDQSI